MHEHKLTLPNQAVWQSMFSFTIAGLITALLLFQLVLPWHKKTEPSSRYIALDLSILPTVVSKVPDADARPAATKTDVAKKTERQTRKQVGPDAQPTVQAITLPVPEPKPKRQDADKDFFTEEKSTASSSLRIDKNAIARAYADSRSDLQIAAGRTGQRLEAVERSQTRQFGRELSRAKISDCIKPNPEGITIGQTTYTGYFAAAALAFNAVTGKCK
jgi:hypothetical protein